MANFEAQVHALTNIGSAVGTGLTDSTTPTEAQLDQFLKDGVIDVTDKCIAVMPKEIQNFQRVSAIINSNGGLDLGGAKIISVLREATEDGSSDGSPAWRACRRIPPTLESRVVDPDSLEFASKYNPVYMIADNNKINVYPVPDDTDDGYKVYYVNNIPTDETNEVALTHAHQDIKWFPGDKIYLVVIYAAIKCIETKMAAMHASIPTYSSTASASGDWAFIEATLESVEDIELGDARVKSLTAEMQQFVAEYQWYQGKVQSLRQEYFTAFDMNKPEPPQAEPQRERRRR